MSPGGAGPVVITNREIWDKLTIIGENVAVLLEREKKAQVRDEDFEQRLRAVEMRMWVATGTAAAAGGTIGAVALKFFG